MTRVAAYCRVSTDLGDQANSFASQKLYFQQYIESRQDWTFAGIYADEGITGTSTVDRTGFLKMISDAQEGKFELLLTKEVSRFSRNILDAVSYTRKLKSTGVGVVFIGDGISTLDSDAELRLGIMASVAQEESRRTSERVKWGQRRRMERGVVFGRSLLGYDVRGGRLTVEPKGAETVRMIYDLYTREGMGVRKIAETLTLLDIRTSTGSSAWSGAAILKILRNEKYCGDLRQRKTITVDYLTHKKVKNTDNDDMIWLKNHHEPIVSRDIWVKAQAELTRRAPWVKPAAYDTTAPFNNIAAEASQPLAHGSRYPLSGKVKCSGCGAVCLCRTRKRCDGSGYRVWRRQCACRDWPYQIREDILERCIRRFIAALDLNLLTRNIIDALTQATAGISSEVGGVNADIAVQEKKLVRLADAYISQDISREAYLKLRDTCENNLRRSKAKLLSLSVTQLKGVEEGIPHVLKKIASGEDLDGNFYLSLLESVSIRQDGSVDIRLNGLTEALHAAAR